MDSDVSLVVDFLNTRDVEADTDVLRSELDWHAWTATRRLRPDALPDAVRARDTLRTLVGDPADSEGDLPQATLDVLPSPTGMALVPRSAVAAVFAAAVRLTVLGEWERVKICPASTCRWAFFDRSRNRSRTWCSMRVCGNREKARTFRERGARESEGNTGNAEPRGRERGRRTVGTVR